MSPVFERIRRSPAFVGGVVVTLVATAILWTIPWLVRIVYADQFYVVLEADTYRMYRLLGGLFGGIAVGLVTEKNREVGWQGAYAAFVGAAIVGVVYYAGTLVMETMTVFSSPPFLYAGVMTLLVMIPIVPSFALGGFVGGILGRELRYVGSDVAELLS